MSKPQSTPSGLTQSISPALTPPPASTSTSPSPSTTPSPAVSPPPITSASIVATHATTPPPPPPATTSTPIPDDVKHPLENRWAMWYDVATGSKKRGVSEQQQHDSWGDNLKRILEFGTVEDFWGMYHHLKVPHEIQAGSNYYLFKAGVMPAWEDPANEKGGEWILKVFPNKHALIDDLWLNTLLAMIGEQFEDFSAHICGAVLSIRKQGDRITLWIKDFRNEAAVKRIGEVFKSKFEVEDLPKIEFFTHDDMKKKTTPARHLL